MIKLFPPLLKRSLSEMNLLGKIANFIIYLTNRDSWNWYHNRYSHDGHCSVYGFSQIIENENKQCKGWGDFVHKPFFTAQLSYFKCRKCGKEFIVEGY